MMASHLPAPFQPSEAQKPALWLRELDTFPELVIGRVNGSAYAGGIGLVSACDIAIGLERAKFAIGEARVGCGASSRNAG